MATAKTNPLDSFKSTLTTAKLQLKPLPRLSDLITNYGLTRGAQIYDEQMEELRRDWEQQINERLAAGTAVTQAPA